MTLECGRRLGAATGIPEHHARRSRPEASPTFKNPKPGNPEPGARNTERNITMASDREKALDAGCDDYDTNPVELPRLLKKMKKLINSDTG